MVAKRELLFLGPFGIAAYLSGLIFIDRVNREKSKNTLNEAMEKLKINKTKLWVFPEGDYNYPKIFYIDSNQCI